MGNIHDPYGAIQTSSRHPQTPSRHPGIHHLFWSKMGHWEKMQYVEIWIATQLFSIVLALIYFIHIVQRVQDIPQEELEVPMVADKVTKMDAKMVIKSIFRE